MDRNTYFTGLRTEYEGLRQELDSARNRAQAVFVFGLTASSALVSLGLARSDWRIVLLANPFILAMGLLSWSEGQQRARVESYIRRFIEPLHPGLRWEGRLAELAAAHWTIELALIGAYIVAYGAMGVASLYLAWQLANARGPMSQSVELLMGLILFANLAALVAAITYSAFGHDQRDHPYGKLWEDVATQETSRERPLP